MKRDIDFKVRVTDSDHARIERVAQMQGNAFARSAYNALMKGVELEEMALGICRSDPSKSNTFNLLRIGIQEELKRIRDSEGRGAEALSAEQITASRANGKKRSATAIQRPNPEMSTLCPIMDAEN